MYVQMDEKTKSTKEVKKDGNMDVKRSNGWINQKMDKWSKTGWKDKYRDR